MPEQTVAQGADLEIVRDVPRVRVVLAALPPLYAHGLRVVLQSAAVDCAVVGDAAQLSGLLGGADALVVVLPEAAAPAVLPLVTTTTRHAVAVLVETATPEVCAQALRSGVTAIITASDEPDRVVTVLRCAAQGQTVLPRDVVQALCRPATLPAPTLTPVEQAWLRRLAAGGTVAGLARSCGYSEREMYRRLSTLYLRLGARTRTEALLLAERFGLLGLV